MSKLFAYGLSFVSSCIATAILATPMPYVVANNDELGQVLEKYAIKRERIDINSRSYNNPALMGVTGISALVSFWLLFKELSNKPLIEGVAIAPLAQYPQQPQQMQSQPVVINNSNRVEVRSPQDRAQQTRPSRTVDDSDLMDSTGEWILKMMMTGDNLKRQHYKIDGVTQSGKTTFAEHLLSILSDEHPLTEKLLIDPKYRKGKPNWSFNPYCSDIEKVPKALDDFAKEIVERQQSENDFGELHPIVFVIDEWDWIYTEYGKNAVTKLRKLIKVGAELGCYVVLIGQSPLSTDAGLSTSDFDQLVRISIGKSAIKVLGNPAQFPFRNRDELLAKAELLFNSGERFALVQEHGVTPRLEIIPKIVKPNQVHDIEDEEPQIPSNKVTPIDKNRRAS